MFSLSTESDILHLVTDMSLCWCVYLQLNLERMAVLFYTSLLLSQAATKCPLTSPQPPPPSPYLHTVRGLQKLKNTNYLDVFWEDAEYLMFRR